MSYASRVRETTTVTGTGDATLLGAVATYVTFTSLYSTGKWVPYIIQGGQQFEEGIAPISGTNLLQRSLGRVLASSSGGLPVDFAAGTKTVDGYIGSTDVAIRLAIEKFTSAAASGDVTFGAAANPSNSFARPADTATYASGDLVANSTTAGSVSFMTLTVGRVDAGVVLIARIKLHKSSAGLTNAAFRVHFLVAQPATITNGDNGAFLVSGVGDYLGACDVTMDRAFTDGACGFGVPIVGPYILDRLASGTTIRACIEARGAYPPVSGETFTLTADVVQS